MARRTSRVSIELGVQDCSRAPENRFSLQQNRFSEPFSKKIGFRGKRVNSHDLRIDSDCHTEVRESIRGVLESIHLCLILNLTFKTALESILPLRNRFLKEEECHRDDITKNEERNLAEQEIKFGSKTKEELHAYAYACYSRTSPCLDSSGHA
ncbi:hypothetical protein PIB30_098732 [Stylosanthes scabra]|uniref:Uncharacterized protein n=1 Tax=Stylosanthes scabra TaxID=79078 RepID=A0ABU6UWA4_9FABA|nr:hypothetical protein [Stylosanthes scabra]